MSATSDTGINPLNPQPGDPYTCNGRRYVVQDTYRAACVHLTCLDPPLASVPGYVGGHSREARIMLSSLRRAPWVAGHGSVLADAA